MAVPNLWGAMCAIAIFSFLVQHLLPFSLDHFAYEPELVKRGEFWRLLLFPLSGGFGDPLTLLFYCMIVYWAVRELEAFWGAGATTFYVALFYLGCLTGSLYTSYPIDLARLGMEFFVITFGTVYPNMELQIYFVIPIKAKWVAALSGVLIVGAMIKGDMNVRIYYLCAMAPYLLFFAPVIVSSIRSNYKTSQNRRKFHDDMWR